MLVLRSISLFVLAAIAEIGGAWLVWQGVRQHRGLMWAGAGVLALAVSGFVAGSLLWGVIFDGFHPDRYDVTGAGICLLGVVVIMYAPRGG